MPGMADELLRLEFSIIPIIVTVTLLIQCQPIDGTIYIFSFTGEDMAVTGLRRHRWRKGISGNSPMNSRLDVSCCEQCAGGKERDADVS